MDVITFIKTAVNKDLIYYEPKFKQYYFTSKGIANINRFIRYYDPTNNFATCSDSDGNLCEAGYNVARVVFWTPFKGPDGQIKWGYDEINLKQRLRPCTERLKNFHWLMKLLGVQDSDEEYVDLDDIVF